MTLLLLTVPDVLSCRKGMATMQWCSIPVVIAPVVFASLDRIQLVNLALAIRHWAYAKRPTNASVQHL